MELEIVGKRKKRVEKRSCAGRYEKKCEWFCCVGKGDWSRLSLGGERGYGRKGDCSLLLKRKPAKEGAAVLVMAKKARRLK